MVWSEPTARHTAMRSGATMKRIRDHRGIALSVVTLLAGLSVALSTQSAQAASTSSFVSFAKFRAGLDASAQASVAGPTEAAQITSYLSDLYRGTVVRASFVSDGAYFDCVTVATQPTIAALGIKRIAPAPPLTVLSPAAVASGAAPISTGADQAGRVISCPTATIPMRRITPQQVASGWGPAVLAGEARSPERADRRSRLPARLRLPGRQQ